MRRSDTGTRRADVERLRELNEFNTGSVDTPKKNGYLEADTRRPAALNRIQALAFVVYLDFQTSPVVPVN